MRKLLFLPLLMVALMLSAATGSVGEKKYLVAGVAFYNLENLFDTINDNGKFDYEFSPEGPRQWTSERYHQKLRNLSRAITSLATPETPVGPAIIGIAEVENRGVVEDLVKAIDSTLVAEGKAPWGLQIVHHDSPDRRGIDVGLLYNPLYFSLDNVNNHRLVIPDDPDFLTRDQLCVSGSLLDLPMSFIVNHWPSRLGGEKESSPMREAAARLSREIADSLWRVDPSQGIVMMGDLNDDPFNKSCAKVFGGVRNREDAKAHGFYNPFWDILDRGVGSLCYNGVWNLFDQIILSGNLVDGSIPGLEYWKCTVFNKPFLRTRSGKFKNYPHRTYSGGRFLNGYSDHFPTEIFLLREVE